jgi:hypothetical protein
MHPRLDENAYRIPSRGPNHRKGEDMKKVFLAIITIIEFIGDTQNWIDKQKKKYKQWRK